jgi:hypothetical protein
MRLNPATHCARGVAVSSRPKRAWGTPDAQCTRGLVCNCSSKTHTSNNEHTGITRRSRTQWFYGLFRALPGDRLFCHRRQRIKVLSKPGRADSTSARLDASIGASGPHDFAVRCNISRPRAVDRSQAVKAALRSHRAQNAAASTASHPAFVTMANAPLVGWDGANL